MRDYGELDASFYSQSKNKEGLRQRAVIDLIWSLCHGSTLGYAVLVGRLQRLLNSLETKNLKSRHTASYLVTNTIISAGTELKQVPIPSKPNTAVSRTPKAEDQSHSRFRRATANQNKQSLRTGRRADNSSHQMHK